MNKKLFLTLVVAAAAAGLAYAGSAKVAGVALMKGTAPDSKIQGKVAFEETGDGLKVKADFTGVPAGEHGFHIHEFGSCEDLGKAAGGHYNPLDMHHGHAANDGLKKAHAGDMGNIQAGEDGQASLEVTLPKKLGLVNGKFNVAGRAVILNEKQDDFGQPLGNAGGRIACGLIGITAKP